MSRARVGADDAVVGIAASGRTPFVLGAVEAAKERRRPDGRARLQPRHAARRPSPRSRSRCSSGAEIIAGSTRLNAGTAQKVVLNIISTAAMVQLGKTYGSLMVDLRATNAKLRDRATRIVAEITGVLGRARPGALELCDWSPKSAAALLAGASDPEAAAGSSSGTAAGCARRSRSSARCGDRLARPGPGHRGGSASAAPSSAARLVRGDVGRLGRRRHRPSGSASPAGARDPRPRRRAGERLRRSRRALTAEPDELDALGTGPAPGRRDRLPADADQRARRHRSPPSGGSPRP